MKIERKRFNFLINNSKKTWRLIKITENRYIYIISFKQIFLNNINFIHKIIILPLGFIAGIILAVWECILDLPQYFKELKDIVLDVYKCQVNIVSF